MPELRDTKEMRITVEIAKSEPQSIIKTLGNTLAVTLSKNGVDYIFRNDCNNRAVLVERKEVSDLIKSFTAAAESGESRLMNQLRSMAARAGPRDLCALLIEGHLHNQQGYASVGKRRSGVPYDAIDNWLMHVQGMGFRIVHSSGVKWTAGRLVSLAKNWLSNTESKSSIRLPKAPIRQLRTLMTFPDIGAKRAKALLEEHGSLDHALHALLICNAGLSDKRQAKIDEYLNGGLT